MKKYILLLILSVTVVFAYADNGKYKGDINADGDISLADMMALASDILNTATYNAAHDLNGDKKIDDADLQELAKIILKNIKSPQSGLDVGIGDWGDGGEFGGSVGVRKRTAASSNLYSISEIKQDETTHRYYFDINIAEQNSTVFCAAIVNIKLPQNVSFSLGNDNNPIVECNAEGSIAANHSLYWKPTLQDDGSLRFIVFNNQLTDFSKASGTIARVYVTSQETEGVITMLPSELATSGNKGVGARVTKTNESAFDLAEISGMLGDCNADKVISGIDVTYLINHILGKTSVNFKENNGDMNKDGNITGVDATLLINLILGK